MSWIAMRADPVDLPAKYSGSYLFQVLIAHRAGTTIPSSQAQHRGKSRA